MRVAGMEYGMHSSDSVTCSRSTDLVVEVKDYLEQLQRENPSEADLFRQKMSTLLQDQRDNGDEEGQSGLDTHKTQLHLFRNWEEERARLGGRLRRGPAQLLANAAVELAACLPLLNSDTDLVSRGLSALEQELRAGIDEMRSILSGLEPPQMMKEMGLLSGLHLYSQRIARQYSITVETLFSTRTLRFSPTVEIGIYRVLQEAMSNAAQHSQASKIMLTVERQSPGWRFAVQDDGSGFEPDCLSHARGLVHMYEWAEAIGGELEVQSKLGYGTTVTLTVDLAAFEDEALQFSTG
jgi:two-component system sensor histidine kinase DegS